MRKFLISMLCVFIGFSAYSTGENIPTSKSYVDSALVVKQDIIEGTNDSPQLLTNTGTAGEYGTKDIYDSTNAYSSQMDALIDAQTMNTAVQNAIDSEFQCVEYNPNDPTDCWLMDIRGAPPQSILPTGYTALEYVVADTNQCIIINVPWGAVYGFRGRAQQKVANSFNEAVFGSSGTGSTNFYGTRYYGPTQEKYWYWAQSESYLDIGEFNFTRVGETDTWAGTVNNVNSNNGNIDVSQNDNVRLLCSGNNKSRWFDGNVWYLQLFDKNKGFLLNAIPAKRDSDGVVGFYDLVSGQMLTNSGSGAFIAGPVMYLPSGN